jgi:hypothetical protein
MFTSLLKLNVELYLVSSESHHPESSVWYIAFDYVPVIERRMIVNHYELSALAFARCIVAV